MNITVIGAGPGGYSAAFAAAKAGASVTLIEKDCIGGTCLHRGCIPTKTLRASADALDVASRLADFGLTGGSKPVADMAAIVARKDAVAATLAGGLKKTAAALRVRLVSGHATLVAKNCVRVTSEEGCEDIASDAIILATGSSPLALPGLVPDHERILSSDDALNLKTVPEHLVVVGGGVIGCELAFIYKSFGARVTVVEAQARLLPLPSIDEEMSRLLMREMKKKGIAVELGKTVCDVTTTEHGVEMNLAPSPCIETAIPPVLKPLEASALCVTVGRAANSAGIGLEELGIRLDEKGWIEVDDTLETSISGIYAIGDAIGPRRIMLAHMATTEAHTAVHNILHPEQKHTQRYDVVPSAIFTSPEISDVGLTEAQARATCGNVRTATLQFRELGKAQAMGALAGLFKLVIDADTDKILGAHIAGAHASDLIAEATLAMQKGCTARDLSETIHAHPTLAEGLFEASMR